MMLMRQMDSVKHNPYARLETPSLVINHCSDVSCSHPSCWSSRKLYRRNAYLLMLKGVPANEIHHGNQPVERPSATYREIPTQKVHNLVDELFRSANDSDDWQSVARGISAGQLSIKHMPTPMSSLSRNVSRLPHSSDEFGVSDTEDEGVDRNAPRAKKPVVQVQMRDMFQPSDPHSVNHSREYVWVPNPNRKPKETVRRSEQDGLGRVNINEELDNYLQEDNYNQRQAALQERAVERSHLSTARVQRFFKSCAPASTAKHIDLFKLPSDLLSEVLKNVDQGEPMTDESLARMVEQAEVVPNSGRGGGDGSDFQRHVLQQRRAQLHNSAGRNLREPHKHTAKTPVFLTTDKEPAAASATSKQRRLPPIAGSSRRQGGGAAAAAATSTNFKRSIVGDCQLMLGPIAAGGALSAASPSSSPSLSGRPTEAAGADDAVSMDVECRSDRSTLLDEVLPSRQPGTRDSGLSALLAMNRTSYDLDDPWADAAEGPHPTTRNESLLMMTSSSASKTERVSVAPGAGRATQSAGICLSLASPANEAGDEAGNEAEEREDDEAGEEDGRDGGLLAPSGRTATTGPGPPPPSPDVDASAAAAATSPTPDADVGRPASPPPPLAGRRSTTAPMSSKEKSGASSGQMPTLNEDEEDED